MGSVKAKQNRTKRIAARLGMMMGMVLLLICLTIPVYADEEKSVETDVWIEQATVTMPDIELYLMGDQAEEVEADQLEAYVADKQIEVSSVEAFDESKEKICYYFLLDISGSIPEDYFKNCKSAVQKMINELDKNETYKVITFGDKVKLLLDGSESKADRKEIFSKLKAKDDTTQLYEALKQTASLAKTDMENGVNRKIGIIFTDALDESIGKSTDQEALDQLTAAGLPLYGMAFEGASAENINVFGEFVRRGRGSLMLSSAKTVSDYLQEMKKGIYQSKIVRLTGDTNQVKQDTEIITLKYKNWNLTQSIEAGFYQWTKDETAPVIESIKQSKKNQVEVIFSENVTGADQPSNFEFSDEKGKVYIPKGSAVQGNTAVLTFEGDLYTGTYVLQCKNITDISMEENKLTKGAKVEIEGVKYSPLKEFVQRYGFVLLAAVVILFLLVVVIIYRRIKKGRGILMIGNKMVLASRVDMKQRVQVEANREQGIPLKLYLNADHKSPVVLERVLNGSIIVGRSKMSDICIEDVQMSRQHFALERQQDNIILTDLESSNGTRVNGVPVRSKVKLRSRDVIGAGNMEIRIEWKEPQINERNL
ncbi:MAG: FHA domain-containing protein [Clostridia bacterium]|nr:FHA domain-containing protein [Clostridia bacterium]NCC42258.1 FHA domain-containing protein [Clostridia bacterium]